MSSPPAPSSVPRQIRVLYIGGPSDDYYGRKPTFPLPTQTYTASWEESAGGNLPSAPAPLYKLSVTLEGATGDETEGSNSTTNFVHPPTSVEMSWVSEKLDYGISENPWVYCGVVIVLLEGCVFYLANGFAFILSALMWCFHFATRLIGRGIDGKGQLHSLINIFPLSEHPFFFAVISVLMALAILLVVGRQFVNNTFKRNCDQFRGKARE